MRDLVTFCGEWKHISEGGHTAVQDVTKEGKREHNFGQEFNQHEKKTVVIVDVLSAQPFSPSNNSF